MINTSIAAVIMSVAGAAVAQSTIHVVAYEGPPPPGFAEGVYFNTFTSGDTTTDGIGVFNALLGGPGINGDNYATTWTTEAGLVLVVQGGDVAPGTDGLTFAGMAFSAKSGADMALFATLDDNHDGIWIRQNGALTLLALEGDTAPGFDPQYTFNTINKPAFNSIDELYFRSSVKPIFGGGSTEVIYSNRTGELSPLLKEGDDAGGQGPLVGPLLIKRLNDAGQFLLDAKTDGDQGIWLFSDNGLTPILKEGDPAPGIEGEVVEEVSATGLNTMGHVAVVAGIDIPGTPYAMSFTNRTGALEPLFMHGEPAPDTEPGTTFNSASDGPHLNNLDQVIFATTINGPNIPGEANFAQWYDDGEGSIQLLLRRDDPLLGAPEGTLIDATGYLDFNDAGQIILLTSLQGDAVDYMNNKVLLGMTVEEPPYVILREGDKIDLGFEDVRTLSDFEVTGRLTNEGRILVHAEFLDETEAILRVSLEESGCPADFNGDGTLNILDYVAFQSAFVAQDSDADCDDNGQFQILDFVCYQVAFVTGCP